MCARLTEHPWKRNRADATERNWAEVKEENLANTWTRTCGMCMKSSQLSALLSSGCDVTGMRGTYEALPVPKQQEEVEDD